MYKQIEEKGVLLNMVRNLENESIIPFDPANTDYQEYLKWLAEGNTPEPADPVEVV